MKLSKLKSMLPSAKQRRSGAIARLSEQLTRGTKPKSRNAAKSAAEADQIKDEAGKIIAYKLSPKDISRISKEIEVLKTRI